MALLWYQEMKWHVIARLPQVDFTLDSQTSVSFIIGAVSRELVPGSNGGPRLLSSVSWGEENRIWQVELDEGFSCEDLLVELGALEENALGKTIHGR